MEILMDLLLMLGGVAVFMFGMKQMSNGLEQSAGSGIRNIFKKINKNRTVNYGIGIGATALVQSSSATSIMTVGLAHAGIVSVKQGAGFILGSKVGTTLSAFIFALSGVSKGGFSISSVFAAFAFVGVLIIFSTENEKLNKIAPFLIGFGMLFIGMEVMESAIGGADSILSIELSKVFKFEIMQQPILLVILGILFTAIIQSSSAATGIFIAFLATGVIKNIDQSFFLVMGANIGTCSDGIMASLTTNAKGKRIALFHVLTSLIGAISFTIILMIFRTPIVSVFERMFPAQPQFSLATFNLIYNTIYTLVLLYFLDPLVNFVNKMIKDKKEDSQELKYIEERFLKTPTVAIEQALMELFDMAVLSKENLNRAFSALIKGDTSEKKQINEVEDRIDFLTNQLADYFIKISSATQSADDEALIGSLHHVANDVERIGDYAMLLFKDTNDLKKRELSVSEQTKEELQEIYRNISDMFDLGFDTLKTREVDNFQDVAELQKKIIKMISATRKEHVARLNSGVCSVEVSKNIYSVLFSLQRVSEHFLNIVYSVRSTTGDETEALLAYEKEFK